MHAETFLREFAPLANGPGGVQKLRELVLQLAVRGKLVPQIAGDGDAEDLLSKLKKRFLQENKKSKYPEAEPLFSTPRTWRWTTMSGVGRIVGGGTPKSNFSAYFAESGIPWLTPADLYGFREKFITRGKRSISELGLAESSARLLPEGSVLFSSRAPIGYTAIAANPLATNQGFKSCVPYVDGMSEYILIYLRASIAEFEARASGTTFMEVSGKVVSAVPIPLPPLVEQKRIVAKVDELMALCDALEARQVEETGLKRAVAASALHNLTEAKGPQEIANGWPAVAENFSRLFDDVENIKELRSAVLEQAYLGAFNDEKPAYTPLEEILAFGPRNGFSPKPARSATDIRSITLSAVTRGKFDQSKFKYIDEVIGEDSHLWLAENDLLIQRANSLEHVGSSTVVQGLSGRYIYPDLIMKMQLLEGFDPQYILYSLQSPSLRTHFRRNATGTSGSMPKINQKVVKSALIPIVSSQAQCTTVNRISNLMALCDRLEEQVREGEQLNAELMASLIHALTETDPDGGGATKAMGLFEGVPETAPPEQGDKGTAKTPVTKGVLVHSNPEPEVEGAPVRPPNVDTKFQEAVLVAAIVNTFFETGGEPIGNFRLQKAVYFARRKMGEHVGEMAYLKKAAGPYNPSMKYSGGIAIAKRKSWLREARGRFGFGHVPGAEVTDAAEWIETYGYGEPARWVADHFRYKKNDEWETLATVDYAVEHLRSLDIDPDAEQILQYITSDPEWHPKIEKLRLTEMSIGTAVLEVTALFNPEGEDESV
ncbi:restriction endonuclease subunit S [Aestuariibius sp. 2305UL40-4]|uniref:restriction endonuclease subunit S n=1 Tax=Aestuariibius violaceus TaxID=3234132 RepID=UPI00345E0B96